MNVVTDQAASAASPLSLPTEQYLTFFLGDEEFGIDALSVDQVLSPPPITPLPHTPDYVLGAIIQRGQVIPVIDLRQRLGMPPLKRTRETCVVAVRSRKFFAGLLVDRVSALLRVPRSDIGKLPEVDSNGVSPVYAIAQPGRNGKMLLDLERVLFPQGEAARR